MHHDEAYRALVNRAHVAVDNRRAADAARDYLLFREAVHRHDEASEIPRERGDAYLPHEFDLRQRYSLRLHDRGQRTHVGITGEYRAGGDYIFNLRIFVGEPVEGLGDVRAGGRSAGAGTEERICAVGAAEFERREIRDERRGFELLHRSRQKRVNVAARLDEADVRKLALEVRA